MEKKEFTPEEKRAYALKVQQDKAYKAKIQEENKKRREIWETNVPDELKAISNWGCLLAFKQEDGSIKKVIVSPRITQGKDGVVKAGHFLALNNKDSWGSFIEASYFGEQCGARGLSFILSENSKINNLQLVCIDLDHVVDDEGKITDEKSQMLFNEIGDTLKTTSTSGHGLHLWFLANEEQLKKLEGFKNHTDNYEMYFDRKIMSDPFNNILSESNKLNTVSDEFIEKLGEVLGKKPVFKKNDYYIKDGLSDRELLDKISKCKGSWKDDFDRMFYNGENIRGGASQTDYALMQILWWASGNIEQTERLFEQSALWTPARAGKKGNSYVRRTVEKISSYCKVGTFNQTKVYKEPYKAREDK